MEVPSTPEALFELVAEPTLREVFPTFDQLPVLQQKLLRTLHTEIATSRLSDETFQELTRFLISVWRSLNRAALLYQDHQIEANDDLDPIWITAATGFHRMDQFLAALLALLDANPQENDLDVPTHYQLRSPEHG